MVLGISRRRSQGATLDSVALVGAVAASIRIEIAALFERICANGATASVIDDLRRNGGQSSMKLIAGP
jgi:hypothetical protein